MNAPPYRKICKKPEFFSNLVRARDAKSPVCFVDGCEVDAMLSEVERALRFIPFVQSNAPLGVSHETRP